ncbi:MAG TPA: hypothetical protein VH280_15900 [Verrucomicrobiae bacterium]|jgi:hypothetical protein|nr:hypothetical protein [Verrucomicrobiae bacterium]
MLARFVWLLFIVVIVPVMAVRAASPAFKVLDHRIIMDNGFVHLEFNQQRPSIDVAKADFAGQGHYGGNLLVTNPMTGAGIVLETIDSTGAIHQSSDVRSSVTYKVLRQDAEELIIRIEGIRDRKFRAEAAGVWTITLPANSRKFSLTAQTTVLRSGPIKTVEISVYANQWFMNGFFQKGVEQYVNCGEQIFFTTNPLMAFYTMDNRCGSLAIVPDASVNQNAWVMRSCDSNGGVGLQAVLMGDCSAQEQWTALGPPPLGGIVAAGTTFDTVLDIYPNNCAFPDFGIAQDNPMPIRDLKTFYTAIYGSAAGVLGSFRHDGSAYPTLGTPKYPYGNLYTFFDPDSWSTVNALSFSGNRYLQEQARRIVELAAAHLKSGQAPHHFIDGTPTYIAISKATQTGPNIFWVLAAIDYADATGNETWLRQHYAKLKAATDWVLDCYDPARKLVKVGGPLFIDVFIRRGYTLDSNAMLLHLLPEMSAVAEFCGDNSSAERYSRLARAIKEGLNAGLWDGHDHYITQRNADWSPRDMVDYDGNYAAVAFGAADQEQAAVILRRLDSGPHTHPENRGTWTSEKYYGPQDCFGGNTGDSATAMARIWWLDLAARRATGDVTNFYKYFQPIQDDLLRNTWLTERYNAEGKSIRAPYYHEYPEITAMILRELVYGIDIKINRIQIKPFGIRSFDYQMGDTEISYNQNRVSLHIPGHSERIYEICELSPDTRYSLSTGASVMTDHNGTAVFTAPADVTLILKNDSLH